MANAFTSRNSVACVLYKVFSKGLALNSLVTDDLTVEVLASTLSSVNIHGYTNEYYGSYLYYGDKTMLVAREDMCVTILEQKVAINMYSQFSATIKTTWESMNGRWYS